MTWIVSITLLLVAAIHLPPVLGTLGPRHLKRLYGTEITDPTIELLMRHRAGLFAIVAGILVAAAVWPAFQVLGLTVGLLSVTSFLILAPRAADVNVQLKTVVRADRAALVLLLIGCVAAAINRT